ncbi:MAG: hypothetical protein R6U26_03565 [Candidatus Undinarchaeales archaeon]
MGLLTKDKYKRALRVLKKTLEYNLEKEDSDIKKRRIEKTIENISEVQEDKKELDDFTKNKIKDWYELMLKASRAKKAKKKKKAINYLKKEKEELNRLTILLTH